MDVSSAGSAHIVSTVVPLPITREPALEVVPTILSTFFLLWLRTLTFELDLDSVTINQRVRYLDHLVEKLLAGHTDRPTDKHTPDDCYSWTSRVTSLAVNWLQGSYPGVMKSAVNSIVCTDSNDLLLEMFNVTPSAVRPVSFPPRHCKTAAARCDLCLERDDCLLTGQRCLCLFLVAYPFPANSNLCSELSVLKYSKYSRLERQASTCNLMSCDDSVLFNYGRHT